ncbi:MAG: prepilin-type N-terminal cleavage/methylation domain-containing protein [Candidatus Marinimicrobia bacterium]|nr:prepilin-type N-terminal cleavage/methylation domain-containing protein [Candidatus Neomarinimicrobiota bacterium]
MNKFRNTKGGFSLIELMIVIVIIGILAAVGVPIYTGNVKKAKQSECDATLGTIRTQLRVEYAENDIYPVANSAVTAVAALDFVAADLTGKYFTAANYTYVSTDSVTFTLTCANNGVIDADRTLDQAGTFAGGNQ